MHTEPERPSKLGSVPDKPLGYVLDSAASIDQPFVAGIGGNAFRLEAQMNEDTRVGARRGFIKRQTAQTRAYSQAVITEGGRIVWLAGQVGPTDSSGRSLAGDFDSQVREVFSRLGRTLEEAGGRLGDIVTMTVFITDGRYGDRSVELRKEIFGDNFPASALITVAGLARPEMLVEVQGIAVIE
jgi:2-iminobutanoate/2-iminopropanoate deaminase